MKDASQGLAAILDEMQKSAMRAAIGTTMRGLAGIGRITPWADPARHGVEVLRDVRYGDGPAQVLDVWRPAASHPQRRGGPLPVVFYVHGGGFALGSKETHWLMGLLFARRGFVCFNVDYRLAPPHPFPAALEDVSHAWEFVANRAADYGADTATTVVAGESAGANLALATTIAACWRRDEPWSRRIFETGVVPSAAIPACGIHQVSDPDRFHRNGWAPAFVASRIQSISREYFGKARLADKRHLELCDPVCVLETCAPPDRPLPPMFIPIGGKDWLIDDSRRLEAAARRHGARAEVKVYDGGIHAFHALIWDKRARACWKDSFAFLDEVLPEGARPRQAEADLDLTESAPA